MVSTREKYRLVCNSCKKAADEKEVHSRCAYCGGPLDAVYDYGKKPTGLIGGVLLAVNGFALGLSRIVQYQPAMLLLSSLALGGFDTGWTGYPPLSARGPVGTQMFFLGVFTAGWSSILGGLNLIATTLRLRAKGMTAFRMPILVWAAMATS